MGDWKNGNERLGNYDLNDRKQGKNKVMEVNIPNKKANEVWTTKDIVNLPKIFHAYLKFSMPTWVLEGLIDKTYQLHCLPWSRH